jgi:adenine-specific DNA-methyltransferase
MPRAKKNAAVRGRRRAAVAVDALTHPADKRKNIPTAETQGLMEEEEAQPKTLRYPRNPDLDPQLVWKGKDAEDADALIVQAVPIYIQEKIHPKAIIDDLRRVSGGGVEPQADLFADFNGIALEDKLDFYQHEQNWSNRMILGDSLMVMASLAEKEALRGKLQMVYFDPPYGIEFRSNWQVSTRDRDVKDGKAEYAPREPEVIKAFRDTWAHGVHSYLTYLRDRIALARDLLNESGSLFVQIGDENVHLVRSILDEVFGASNFVTEIVVKKKGSQKSSLLDPVNDYILWYGRSPRDEGRIKFRTLYERRELDEDTVSEFSRIEFADGKVGNVASLKDSKGEVRDFRLSPSAIATEFPDARLFRPWPITNGGSRANQNDPVAFEGGYVPPPNGRCWAHTSKPKNGALPGMTRLNIAGRLMRSKAALDYKRYLNDFPYKVVSNWWDGFGGASDPIYVVQTNERIVERCLLMTTDPGDLVLDPTCGSGTTAYIAEQWGRRWITIDTSRVALALARQRLMAARYRWYLLRDSEDGGRKDAEITDRPPSGMTYGNNIRQGFVSERAPHIASSSIANDAEIDVIQAKWQEPLAEARLGLNTTLHQSWEEWQVPREADPAWPQRAKDVHAEWWTLRRERQVEMDASIARNADVEFLYDRPYERPRTVRVTGPFTVESLSPHRVLAPEEDNDELLAAMREEATEAGKPLPERRPLGIRPQKTAPNGDDDFVRVAIDNLEKAGVQNTKKQERLVFRSIEPYTGSGFLHAQGRYQEGNRERLAAIFIGPEYGTVSREMVMQAAREARDIFDVLVVCGFAFDPHVGSETMSLGRLTVLKARMNEDLHMAEHLKKTGAGNLFVVFGEPDIEVEPTGGSMFTVKVKGVDIFDPTTGEIRSSDDPAVDIACWFLDSDYDGDSFFVRHAYFLGRDPYERLKRALRAEIDEAAWTTLNSTASRPFPAPKSGRIAVKVINHYGDEVMKVFRVSR